MGNFQGGRNRNKGFKSGNGKPPFKNKSWGGERSNDRPAVMHQAVCDECGKPCEVPFKPTGQRPVYCRDCFNAKREDGGESRQPRQNFENRGAKKVFNDRPSFPQDINLDFTPTPPKEDYKKQFVDINEKLDKLITLLEKQQTAVPTTTTPTPEIMSVKQKTPAKKKVAQKQKK
jgi:CxxC-x17-CxxC domain-containing protein